MTLDRDLSDLSDEDYLAARSRQARNGTSSDILSAKAWLITSCLMFPNNYQVHSFANWLWCYGLSPIAKIQGLSKSFQVTACRRIRALRILLWKKLG